MGEKLAFDIPPSAVKPEVYIEQAQTTFSMRSPTVNAVFKKLKAINERKAAGPDKVPCKLLKIAAEVIAPSLTQIFNKAIGASIFPDDWKLARVRYSNF